PSCSKDRVQGDRLTGLPTSRRSLFGRSRSGAAPWTAGRRGPSGRRIILRTRAGLAGGGEVGWNLLRDLACGRPFRPTLVGGDEAGAVERGQIVPHHGVKDPPLAIRQDHENRL